jgi:predicted transposase/invertase (TIGR01784 family)
VLDVSEAEGGSMDYLMTVAEANPEAMEEIIMRKATMRNSVLYDIVSRSPLGEDLVKKGKAEGMAEGEAKGEAKGILTATLNFARSLAQQGVSFDIIKNSTGFTEAELAKLGIVR